MSHFNAATTLVGISISVVAAGFAAYQGWVARDTEKRQLRAYLTVESVTLRCPACVDQKWKAATGHTINTENAVVVNIKNDGITPANDVVFYPNAINYLNTPLFPLDFKCPEVPRVKGYDAPYEAIVPAPTIGSQHATELLDPHTPWQIMTLPSTLKGGWVALCGKVFYTDVFLKRWNTPLCYVLDFSQSAPNGIYNASVCPRGGFTDQQNDIPEVIARSTIDGRVMPLGWYPGKPEEPAEANVAPIPFTP
jgi:hypothetical protein